MTAPEPLGPWETNITTGMQAELTSMPFVEYRCSRLCPEKQDSAEKDERSMENTVVLAMRSRLIPRRHRSLRLPATHPHLAGGKHDTGNRRPSRRSSR